MTAEPRWPKLWLQMSKEPTPTGSGPYGIAHSPQGPATEAFEEVEYVPLRDVVEKLRARAKLATHPIEQETAAKSAEFVERAFADG